MLTFYAQQLHGFLTAYDRLSNKCWRHEFSYILLFENEFKIGTYTFKNRNDKTVTCTFANRDHSGAFMNVEPFNFTVEFWILFQGSKELDF